LKQEFKRIWKIYRARFKTRLLINSIIVICITYFRIFSTGIIGLFLTLTFFISSELFIAAYYPIFASNISLMWNHRKKVRWIEMPREVADLVDKMNMKGKVERFGVYPKLRTAYVLGRSVVIGEELLRILSKNQCLAIIAHEINHIKGKHSLVKALFIIPIYLSIIGAKWTELPYVMCFIGSLAYVMILMIPLNWALEVKSDIAAAKFVGKEHIKSALLALVDQEKYEEHSETHPSIKHRIKKIEKLVSS